MATVVAGTSRRLAAGLPKQLEYLGREVEGTRSRVFQIDGRRNQTKVFQG